MSDPRRIAAHLAEELAAVGAPMPVHDQRFGPNRLVAVCDVPQVVTFGTDGLRVWWQARGRPCRHQYRVREGGLAVARDALVRAAYAMHPPDEPPDLGCADDASAAAALAADLRRLLPRAARIEVAAGQPCLLRVRAGRAAIAVRAAGGWYLWPDPHPDLTWHLIGLRRCLHAYRHVAVARLLTIVRPSSDGPAPTTRPPTRPGAAA